VKKDSDKRKLIQISFEKMMNEIILKGESEGLKNSFFLHISPNLGNKNGRETIKLSSQDDIGSTDIQLLIKGAVKDSGVLFLLNKYIEIKTKIIEKIINNIFFEIDSSNKILWLYKP